MKAFYGAKIAGRDSPAIFCVLVMDDEKNRINLPRKDFLCIIDLAILSFDS